MVLVEHWMPPSRENWELILWGFQWFPLVCSLLFSPFLTRYIISYDSSGVDLLLTSSSGILYIEAKLSCESVGIRSRTNPKYSLQYFNGFNHGMEQARHHRIVALIYLGKWLGLQWNCQACWPCYTSCIHYLLNWDWRNCHGRISWWRGSMWVFPLEISIERSWMVQEWKVEMKFENLWCWSVKGISVRMYECLLGGTRTSAILEG